MAQRLLIVEDDPAISHMMAQILSLEGYEATVVAEGGAALDVLRAGSFDAVILDIMLPDVDGIEIMRGIRKDPAISGVPVVMLTAKTDDQTTWEGWRAGCNYFMTKPFEPEQLVEILERIRSD